jgi:hypothetical protein
MHTNVVWLPIMDDKDRQSDDYKTDTTVAMVVVMMSILKNDRQLL